MSTSSLLFPVLILTLLYCTTAPPTRIVERTEQDQEDCGENEQITERSNTTTSSYKLATCPLPAVLGGTVTPATFSVPVGATYEVYCQEGFTICGHYRMTCQSDGTYDDTPTCAPLQEDTVREFHTLNIDCGTDRAILIHDASYAIVDHPTAGGDECSAANALTKITAACNRLNECSVNATNSEFGNPCPWVIKKLTISYSCHCDCALGISENYESVGLIYASLNGTVTAYTPERVARQVVDNVGLLMERVLTLSVSEEITETVSFNTTGMEVADGIEFDTGIPLVTNGTITTQLSASYNFSSGTERAETKYIAADYQCVAPPGGNVTCEAYLYKYQISVPYTQTWKHKTLDKVCKVQGVLTELAASAVKFVVGEDVEDVVVGSGGFGNVSD